MERTLSVGATAGVMRGMRGVVFGVANNRSIAWGIARAAHAAGAELAFTFQGEALEKRVRPLAQELGAHVLGHCDVTEGGSIDFVFAEAGKLWGAIDFIVHCIAFADKDQLTGRYIDTTEDNFTKSLADLLLFVYRRGSTSRKADDQRRRHADPDLLWRGKVDAPL